MPRRPRRLATVLLAAAVAVPLLPGTRPALAAVDRGARVGFANGAGTPWLDDEALHADLAAIRATGGRWLRVDFDWSIVQFGGRDSWNWRPYDRMVQFANEHGVRLLALATYTPPWARPDGATTNKVGPRDPDDFARFLREAVRRYAPLGVHAWEIWNEPNHGDFWQRPDPAAYTRLLRAAAAAVRAEDSGATIVSGGLSPGTDVPGEMVAPNTFVREMYESGAAGAFDALGIHPYSFPWSPTHAGTWNTFYMLPYTYELMKANGDGGKRIWATEVGWGTGRDERSLGEAAQAGRAREVLEAWFALPFSGNLFWYTLRDFGGSGEVWRHMGVLRRDHGRKESFSVFRAFLTGDGAPPTGGDGSRDGEKRVAGPWLVGPDARVVTGTKQVAPATLRTTRRADVVAAAAHPRGRGAWMVTEAGRVIVSGDVRPHGGVRGTRGRVAAMAATPTGRGYWIATRGGRVRAFGDAPRRGGAAGARGEIVDMAATPTGRGYWLVTPGGRVHAFGDADRERPRAGRRPSRPVVGITGTRDGRGYWLVTAGGKVFSYGTARGHGSPDPGRLAQRVVDIVRSPGGRGYWLVTARGRVLDYGDAPGARSARGFRVAAAVVPGS